MADHRPPVTQVIALLEPIKGSFFKFSLTEKGGI